ncbi:MAG: hypothetical protein HYT36_02035 [Candidatus Staskawiczbacteria bacterium]|nr:hypothetical protein [Candidatus Staskawiczbacteria bacterium]
MEDNKSRLGFWGWFGRISAVIFFIVAIIAIGQFTYSQWRSPDAPKLKVAGEYYEWPSTETSIRADLFWRFDIENTGGKVAKNIRVEFPFFVKIDLGEGSEPKEFNKGSPIQIEDLQPSNKKTLRVWSSGDNFYKDYVYKNDIKITHDDGIETVNYPVQVYGIMAWIIDNSFVLLLILSGAIIWLSSMVLINSIEKQKNNPSK